MKSLITLIGCGKMGSAMLHGWLADSSLNAEFAIIEPAQDHLAWTSAHDNVRFYATVADAAAGRVLLGMSGYDIERRILRYGAAQTGQRPERRHGPRV